MKCPAILHLPAVVAEMLQLEKIQRRPKGGCHQLFMSTLFLPKPSEETRSFRRRERRHGPVPRVDRSLAIQLKAKELAEPGAPEKRNERCIRLLTICIAEPECAHIK